MGHRLEEVWLVCWSEPPDSPFNLFPLFPAALVRFFAMIRAAWLGGDPHPYHFGLSWKPSRSIAHRIRRLFLHQVAQDTAHSVPRSGPVVDCLPLVGGIDKANDFCNRQQLRNPLIPTAGGLRSFARNSTRLYVEQKADSSGAVFHLEQRLHLGVIFTGKCFHRQIFQFCITRGCRPWIVCFPVIIN